MVKDTQTIRRQIADELFECVRSFCEIGAKRVNLWNFEFLNLLSLLLTLNRFHTLFCVSIVAFVNTSWAMLFTNHLKHHFDNCQIIFDMVYNRFFQQFYWFLVEAILCKVKQSAGKVHWTHGLKWMRTRLQRIQTKDIVWSFPKNIWYKQSFH